MVTNSDKGTREFIKSLNFHSSTIITLRSYHYSFVGLSDITIITDNNISVSYDNHNHYDTFMTIYMSLSCMGIYHYNIIHIC